FEVRVTAQVDAQAQTYDFAVELRVVENQMAAVKKMLKNATCGFTRNVSAPLVVDRNVDAFDTIRTQADASDFNLDFVSQLIRAIWLFLHVDQDASIQTIAFGVYRESRTCFLAVCAVTGRIREQVVCPRLESFFRVEQLEGFLSHPRFLGLLDVYLAKTSPIHGAEIGRRLRFLDLLGPLEFDLARILLNLCH